MPETYIDNGGVRLHVLADGSDGGSVPLLIAPGLSESAFDYADLIEALAPRRVVAVTFRGRGRSDAPTAGYGLDDHVGDLAVAARLLEGRRFCLLACSRAVAYGLGYAVEHPSALAGLILGDYPARHSALPGTFPDWFLATSWRGTPAAERIAAHAVHAIQRESAECTFWDRLPDLRCPALILHGEPACGSQLSAEQIERYRSSLPHPSVVGFPGSGHDLRDPEPTRFHQTVRRFLEQLDADAGGAE